jgi:hypothetical protein
MMSFAQHDLNEDQTSHAVDLSFAAIEEKRDGKMSGKKSALYRKIMKDHNLPINSSNTKLNYNIESLVTRDLSHQKPKQAVTKLTETKPFDFETNKRA